MRETLAMPVARARRATPDLAGRLGEHVIAALIEEATLAPKPGLVDIRSRGAHHDLDWELMCVSALALQPTFTELARAGLEMQPMQSLQRMQSLRERIGAIGRDGEARMLDATQGVNTHRGAIWALGLLVTAAAAGPTDPADPVDHTPHAIAARAGALARLPDRHAPALTGNKGERACLDYNVGGARGQAQAGFPHVVDVALPELSRSRRRGDSETAARLNALLAIMASLDDTCVLARGGPGALVELQDGARRVLALGGAASRAGRRAQ
jgi:triphosphoribosyl-dephospho-CoA synthase